MTDLVTIIVPVHRVEAYLDECVESLVSQTHSDLDIILVDDGSPDGSGLICDQWATRDERIRVIHKPNGGPSSARNAGLDAARGAFITFVDADDIVASDLVERMLELSGASNADIVSVRLAPFVDGPTPFTWTNDFSIETAENELLRIARSGIGWEACGKLHRAGLLGRSLRFTEGILYEDLEFTPRAFGAARRVVLSGSCLYGYRQRDDSIMGCSRKATSPDLIWALRSNLAFAGQQHGRGTKLYREFQTAYILHASKQLERVDSFAAWRGGRDYRRAYSRFLADNRDALDRSAQWSRGYRLLLGWSRYSPTAFILAFRLGHSLKRHLFPELARRVPSARRNGDTND